MKTIGKFILLFLEARKRYGFYIWYFIIIIVALIGSLSFFFRNEGIYHLYFSAFLLGMATAFAEIISTFSDEPLKALQTPHAVLYHLMNGLIAVFALYVLIISGVKHTTSLDRMQIVFAAGLGSMLIMRSKLFNIKIGNEDISFGPEQVIKVFFRYMQTAIDRVRARSRIDFVKLRMHNIDFDKVHEYSLSMLLAAPLTLDEKSKKDCEEGILNLKDSSKDKQLKSYELGFILLNRMGEDFLNTLFEKPETSWLMGAPLPPKPDNSVMEGFLELFSVGEEIPYMTYGASMSGEIFRKGMGWSDIEETRFYEMVKPRKCVLNGYRLVFNKPVADNPEQGKANIVKDDNGTVEGVLYDIPKISMDFLDLSAGGYVRKQAPVLVDKKQIEAQIFVAETTREGLRPKREYIEEILEGARQHELSSDYQQQIEAFKATAL